MLIEKIKADLLHARKARLVGTVNALTTLVGEAEMVGKNAGSRAPTDDEVLAVVKKFVKNIDETLKCLQPGADSFTVLTQERVMYAVYLPEMMSEQAITDALSAAFPNKATKAEYMKFLKENFTGKYDGKTASAVVDKLL